MNDAAVEVSPATLAFQFLRRIGLIGDELLPTKHAGGVIAKVTCNDDRTLFDSTRFARQVNECNVLVIPSFGGAIRLSDYCPGQGAAVHHLLIDEVRYGMERRAARCLNTEVHGEECAKCDDLGQGVAQRIWLANDARGLIKARIRSQKWCAGEDVGVFSTYHRRVLTDDGERQLTYPIVHDHPLFRHINMPTIVDMDDKDFLAHAELLMASLQAA